MKKKTGFIFVETVLVITILTGCLLMVYNSFVNVLNNEKRRSTFNDASYAFKSYYIQDFITSLNINKYIEDRMINVGISENDKPRLIKFECSSGDLYNITNNETNINVYYSWIDGVIRNINFPPLNSNNNDDIINKYTLNPWRAHQDMIWELNYHPSNNLLSSVSSDGTVKIFKTYEENKINMNEKNNNIKHYYSYDSSCKNLVRNFMFRNRYFNFVEIPTSCSWSSSFSKDWI